MHQGHLALIVQTFDMSVVEKVILTNIQISQVITVKVNLIPVHEQQNTVKEFIKVLLIFSLNTVETTVNICD